MRFTTGGGGWVLCQPDGGETAIEVKLVLDEHDGRLVPAAVDIRTYGPLRALTEADLRDVPLNEIEAAANGPELRDRLIERIDEVHTKARHVETDDRGGAQTVQRRKASGKVPVPDGPRYPDSFYRRVAVEYTRLVAGGERGPARVIAEANEVPVTTVHRWVKEARSRGHLAAGRTGRAG